MKYRLFLVGFLTIAVFDIVGSIASRQFNFSYVYLVPGSFILYGVFGFIGTKKLDLKTGVLTAALVGFFDSTAGWKISMVLNANVGGIRNDPTATVWIITIVFVTALAAACGLVGGGLAKYLRRELTTHN